MKTGRIDMTGNAGAAESRGDGDGKALPSEGHESVAATLRAVVHELSQPLTACRGALELALRKPRSNAEYRKALEKAFAAAERMTTAVQLVQELAEVFVPALRTAPVELASLARHVVEELAPLAESHGVAIRLELVPGITVLAEEERLRRALLKVLHHAIMHSPAHCSVHVSLALRSGEACLLFQGEADPWAETRRTGGAGLETEIASANYDLALVVARKAIESLGGSLTSEDAPPHGRRYSIRIPRARRTPA
jgi:signal transduction histidine kinase